MTGHPPKFLVAGLMGFQFLLAQAIRTGWREWPFPESLLDPPVSPTHLAVNRFQDLYIVDGDNHRIVVIPGDGSPPETGGGWGDRRDLFSFPTDIVASPGLDVLVCDNATHRILVFDRRLNYVGEKVLPDLVPKPLEYPYKIAQNQLGHLVVVSSGQWEVSLISPAGNLVATLGGAAYGRGRFGEISDVALGAEDRIGLVDISRGMLVILSREGELEKTISLPGDGSKLVEWWRDRWLVMGPWGQLYELYQGSEFRLIPSEVYEEKDRVPRDFVVVDNVVYMATDAAGYLVRTALTTLED